MKNSRRDKILAYAKEETKKIISQNLINETGGDALSASLDLGFDRANVSKDLNSLWKEGKLVKIQGKPVYFLDFETLTDYYPNLFFPTVISKDEKLSNYFNHAAKKPSTKKVIVDNDPLNEIIGSNGSLKDIIVNAKSAVSYPPNGINCLIYGNQGVGKTYLANRMYEYACMRKESKLPFATMYCQNYLDDPKQFTDELLGYKKRNGREIVPGIFERCKGGMILIEQIELLPPSSRNMLLSIIAKKAYTPTGSLLNIPLECMIIITAETDLSDPALKDVLSTIPIQLELKDVEKRGIYEKIELILNSFQIEAKRINADIKVKKDIICCFAQAKYNQNIIEMNNEIQLACGKAYFNNTNSSANTIFLTFRDLSIKMLSLTESKMNLNSNILNLLSCIPSDYLEFNADGSSTAASIFHNAPTIYSEHRFNQFIDEFSYDVNNLDNIDNYILDNISVLKNCPKNQLFALKKNINPVIYEIVLKKVSERVKFNSLNKNYHLLYGILLHITNQVNLITKDSNYYSSNNKDDKKSRTSVIYPDEYSLACDIYSSIGEVYNFVPLNREIDFLASYIFIINQWANNVNVGVLLIMHGESIATQMMDYIRQTVDGDFYIDAIDFNSEMQLNDCLELSCLKCSELNKGAGVVILCDFEPLTSVGDYVYQETRILTKTISNVSLSKVINVVEKSKSQFNNLLSFDTIDSIESVKRLSLTSNNDFINQVVDKVIIHSVSFLDLNKYIPLLVDALNSILHALNQRYDNAICTKFLCHTSVMLERVIKNETWEFQKINTFISSNHKLIHIVEHSFEYISNLLGVKIPAEEIAYVAQIFLLQD